MDIFISKKCISLRSPEKKRFNLTIDIPFLATMFPPDFPLLNRILLEGIRRMKSPFGDVSCWDRADVWQREQNVYLHKTIPVHWILEDQGL